MAPKSKAKKPTPPLRVEGGQRDPAKLDPAPAKSGGMIGEGAPDPGDRPRDGGMIGEG
jgi:hypothetical protein